MDKELLFRTFSLILWTLASFLAGCATTLVFSFNARNASKQDLSLLSNENKSNINCGIVPYQGLNPWTVEVVTQTASTSYSCGGSFISSTRILTATHCIDVNKTQSTRYDVVFNRRSYEASLVAFEPDYYQKMIGDGKTDLAILEVKEKPALVVPLCLPPENYFVENADLILTSPRGGYHEKVIPVIDGITCWQRYFRNQVAANSSWCDKDQEFKMAVEAYEEEWRNKIEDFDRKSLKALCSASPQGKKYAIPGDSGSPLVQHINGRWTLIAIARGFHTYQWKENSENLCDEQTKKVEFDDFQPLVPNLPWIYEQLK